MADEPTLYLVDGSGYIFRGYFAVPHLSTSKGLPTNAVLGFARMLLKLLKEESPDYVLVAFDTARKTFRSDMYPAYKANRPPPPEDLVPQFELCREFVRALNIPALEAPGYEADDIIGTLVDRASDWGLKAVVVSGDKDLLQLVDEQTVMLDTMKSKRYGPDEVVEKLGVTPSQVADMLGLAGDSSDNIPGVPGIGPKTAATLLERHGDLESLLANADGVKGKRGEALRAHADDARLSRDLATICRTVPVEMDKETMRREAPDGARLTELCREWEFHRLLAELVEMGTEGGVPTAGAAPGTYRCLTSLDEIRVAVEEAVKAPMVAVDTETTSLDPMRAELVGVSLAWVEEEAVYIPLGHHYLGVPEQPPMEAALDLLRPLLEDPGVPKVGQNHKYDRKVLQRAGVELRGVCFDPMLASYLLRPGRVSHGLDHLALEFFNHSMVSFKTVMKGVSGDSFASVPLDVATEYAAEDADYTLRLVSKLSPMIEAAELGSLLNDMELPLAEVLAQMEMLGIRVDRGHLELLSEEFRERIEVLADEIHGLAGRSFLISSTKQLGEILFDELDLPVIKKTKTARSTDQSVLEELSGRHPLPSRVLAYRHLTKLKSTYVDALPAAIHPETGRIHPSFKQAVAATGRLSCDSPNLQNIPVRTEEGRRIRAAFVAPAGSVILSADYSQIELRLLAHLSGDPALVSAFNEGMDIHTQTASEVFNVFPAMVSDEQRRAAKAINFGLMYGMSAFRLARELGIGRAKAKSYIDAYFARYSRVRAFIDDTLSQARASGFVETMLGRRRYLPELNARNHTVRGRAEREAVNSPVQGTAADLLKLAMLAIQRSLESGEIQARMLLTVHDELLFEVSEERVVEVGVAVKKVMEGVATLSVPLVVDVAHGPNWAEAK